MGLNYEQYLARIMEQEQEYRNLVEPLNEDVYECLKIVRESDSQSARRMYVRSVFAAIEGAVFAMKQNALQLDRLFSAPLTNAEKLFIEEESFELNDNGEPRTTKARISLTKNIRFAFYVLARVSNLSIKLKVDDNGWICFRESIKVRDRLTHPKKSTDLIVTEDELDAVHMAHTWFISSMISFSEAQVKVWKEMAASMQNETAKLDMEENP